jgi:hypothetical protein
LIRAEIELVQANISTNPDDYRRLLASLSTEDRKIYNASFEKSINVDLGGDPAAYTTMLERCGALKSECEFVQVDKQPTSDLIPLVLMVREEIPAYKTIVQGAVAQAAASRGLVTEEIAMLEAELIEKQAKLEEEQNAAAMRMGLGLGFGAADTGGFNFASTADAIYYRALKAEVAALSTQITAAKVRANGMTTSYRDQTKSPYRMVEKALTKGPNREYPDCSQILDVFGCIIDCQDYAAMAAGVDTFADQHKAGVVQIARMKDRWNTPSEGGWRDLMLNIVVNGKVAFEVQVVLHAMLVARKALDAHTAYNQFRSFAEVFRLLELSMGVVGGGGEELDGGRDGGDEGDSWGSTDESSAAAAPTAVSRIFELEAENKRLVGEVTALAAGKAAVEAEKAKVEAEKAFADERIASVEAEKAAVEADKALAYDRIAAVEAEKAKLAAKVETLQAQLAGRE